MRLRVDNTGRWRDKLDLAEGEMHQTLFCGAFAGFHEWKPCHSGQRCSREVERVL